MFAVVRKKKSIWQRLLESKPHEYRSIKILFLFPIGLFVGIGMTRFLCISIHTRHTWTDKKSRMCCTLLPL